MPAASAACRMVEPAGTSTSRPSMVSLGIRVCPARVRRTWRPTEATPFLLRCHAHGLRASCLVGCDPLFHHRPEMPDQPLYRPCRGVTQRTDRVAFNLPGHLLQRIDLGRFGTTLHHAHHHAPHPSGAFTARRALAAAFMHE